MLLLTLEIVLIANMSNKKKSRKLGTFTRHSFFDFFIKYDNRNFSIEIYKFYGFTGTSVMQVVCNYSHPKNAPLGLFQPMYSSVSWLICIHNDEVRFLFAA